MSTSIWRLLFGAVEFCVEGGLCERFLNECMAAGLSITGVKATPLGFFAWIPARQYKRLHSIAHRCRCRVRIEKRKGLIFNWYRYRKRYGIFVGFVCCCLLCTLLESSIWTISYYNLSAPLARQLGSELHKNGIIEGMRPDSAALAQIRQKLLLENPEFASISLNFIKGRLLVEATSNLKKPTVLDNTTPMDIVSAKRGIIEHIEIYSGYAVCKVGQLVEPGTLLVSHQYTDPLTNTSVSEYAHAKIQAKTVTIYCCEQPYEFAEQVPTGESVSYSALCVGKKELPLYRAQTLPSTYEKTEILRPLAPMGWCLPAALKTETIVTTTQKKIILSAKAAETRARYRCYQQINADYAAATIETVEEKSVTNEDALVYTIIVTAVEQIEKLQQPLEIN